MASKTLAYSFMVLLIGGFLLALVPEAAAQNTKLKIEGVITEDLSKDKEFKKYNGAVPPESIPYKVKFKFKVTVEATSECLNSVQVKYTVVPIPVKDGSGILDKQSQTESIPDSQPQPNQAVPQPVPNTKPVVIENKFETTMSITFTRDAAALRPVTFVVKADAVAGTATGTCNIQNSDVTAELSFQIAPGYVSRVTYQPKAYTQNSGQNKQVVFPITMTNFSNGPTKIQTAVTPKSNGLDALTPPADVILDPSKNVNSAANNVAEVVVTGRTPANNGYTNRVETFEVKFTGKYDGQDPSSEPSVDEKFLTLSVKVQGVYVPGFDASSLLAALGAVMVVGGIARRRL